MATRKEKLRKELIRRGITYQVKAWQGQGSRLILPGTGSDPEEEEKTYSDPTSKKLELVPTIEKIGTESYQES